MIYTTLNKIRAHSPCSDGWGKLLRHLGKTQPDNDPLGLDVILTSNGIDDALWCLRSVPDESRRWRHLAVRFANTVKHLMTDQRSLAALDVAQRHADGLASDAELMAAGDAAWAAAGAAAEDAARAAAEDAAWAAAEDAARAAWAAARAAAEDTWDAAVDALPEIFLDTLNDVSLAPLAKETA